MVWGRWDDHAPFHGKFLGLSNDATALIWRAVLWARGPGAKRPGFLTEKQLAALRGDIGMGRFRLVLRELIEAGKPAHEYGILVPADGGYEIHDFDDYGPPGQAAPPREAPPSQPPYQPKVSESARRAGLVSAEVRRQRYGSAQPRTGSPNAPEQSVREEPHGLPNGVPHAVERPRTEASTGPARPPARPRTGSPNAPEPNGDLTCQVSSEFPDPDPGSSTTRAREPFERNPRTESRTLPNGPFDLESALKLPIQQRASCASEPGGPGGYLCPERWPEVVSAAKSFSDAWGQRLRIGNYSGDAGVRALVVLFAAGFTVEELDLAAKLTLRNPWFEERRRRALRNLTPEVVRQTLALATEASAGGSRSRKPETWSERRARLLREHTAEELEAMGETSLAIEKRGPAPRPPGLRPRIALPPALAPSPPPEPENAPAPDSVAAEGNAGG